MFSRHFSCLKEHRPRHLNHVYLNPVNKPHHLDIFGGHRALKTVPRNSDDFWENHDIRVTHRNQIFISYHPWEKSTLFFHFIIYSEPYLQNNQRSKNKNKKTNETIRRGSDRQNLNIQTKKLRTGQNLWNNCRSLPAIFNLIPSSQNQCRSPVIGELYMNIVIGTSP